MLEEFESFSIKDSSKEYIYNQITNKKYENSWLLFYKEELILEIKKDLLYSEEHDYVFMKQEFNLVVCNHYIKKEIELFKILDIFENKTEEYILEFFSFYFSCKNYLFFGESIFIDFYRKYLEKEFFFGKISRKSLNEAMKYIYEKSLNDEFRYSDNYRIANLKSKEDFAIYSATRRNGCCGFFDEKIKIDDEEYWFGFNYGH